MKSKKKITEIEKKAIYLLAENLSSHMNPQKFVDWAIYVLENNLESENLLILAGLDNCSREEIEKYFWKSIDDLKLNLKKPDYEPIYNFALYVANSVLEKKIPPMEGLSLMNNIIRASDYSEKYIQFYYLEEDIDHLKYEGITLFNSFNTSNIDETIIKEFELFLRVEKINMEDKYREFAYCLDCQTLNKPKLKNKKNWIGKVKSHYWLCPNCGSKKIEYFSSQKGKELILNELENNL